MWHVIEADSGNELWSRVMTTLRGDTGVHSQPSRLGDTRELLHAALTLRHPRRRWMTARRPPINPAFALAEIFWIMGGRRDAQFIRYFNRSLPKFVGPAPELHGAYGYRLRRHFGVDQLEDAFESLKANSHSRQIVLQIWDAKVDLPRQQGQPRDPDIPCNTQSILKVRGGKLEWLQVMRSNDAYLGLPYNVVQFTMLQEIIAGWLGIEPGEYHHVCDSLHLYERNLHTPDGEMTDDPPDMFALPKEQSDKVIAEMIAAIGGIVDERQTVADIQRIVAQARLPDAYRSALCVLSAEGMRRRHDSPSAAHLMADMCTSRTFNRMWANWYARVKTAS